LWHEMAKLSKWAIMLMTSCARAAALSRTIRPLPRIPPIYTVTQLCSACREPQALAHEERLTEDGPHPSVEPGAVAAGSEHRRPLGRATYMP
jgi:hypothetical protein